jgi:hypothetical protein
MPGRSSLARLLQVACLSQIGLAVAWLVGRWTESPSQSLLGAALIVAIAPLALAVEFVIVWRFSRHDAAPKPTVVQLLRAWFSETGATCFKPSTGGSLSAGAVNPITWRAPAQGAPALCWSTASCATALLERLDARVARARPCLSRSESRAGVRVH